jgi:hypothetical protein
MSGDAGCVGWLQVVVMMKQMVVGLIGYWQWW